ncbi:MAG: amidohydrolase family protein [Gammaproteobacteria bacterium]|nr:amidohydrolase family protein [Gammaproteobacteria bacterium]MBT8106207.1 amidohydrolase family protein [Gammaproteobacteria bacterium]NNK26221.1 amidohydrolase family protein [Woeseiaceae bacterium]
MIHRAPAALCAAALLHCGVAAADVTLLHAGELLAVPGEPPAREMTVIVEDGVITGVQKGYVETEGATIVDLKDRFVLPGLMDMHVHLQGELGPDNDRDTLKMSPQLMQMRSAHYAMNTLLAGFTTVRDVGSSEQEMYALRDAIEAGWIDGPRIIAAGGVGITGGHADISGVSPDLMKHWTSTNVCDGPYDCRRAARNVIKYGGDLIKITSTGGVMTQRATGTGQQMEMDELTEIVRAATRMGRKVASHAHEEDGIIAALEAGVASIEHGTYTGPRAIRLFKETGAYLVPTLLAGKTVATMAVEADFMAPEVRKKAVRVGNDMAGSFARAHKAGVRVAYGTDSGISPHGTNAEEAVLMVEAGMSEMDVIVAATISAADLIDMSDALGTIENGKQADIIAVDASPLDDIAELLEVDFVMKGGAIYKE